MLGACFEMKSNNFAVMICDFLLNIAVERQASSQNGGPNLLALFDLLL